MLYSKSNKKQIITGSKTPAAYKKIKMIATAVLSSIIITMLVVAALYIPAAIEIENQRRETKSKINRYTYSFAIDYRNTEGITIPDAWTQGLRYSDFSYNSDNPSLVTVDKGGRLTVTEGGDKDKKATITYKLDGKIACIIYVNVVQADGYITSASDLTQLNDSSGTYIQSEDIVLSFAVQVKNFKGKYFGNHLVISGHNMQISGGGLFDRARSAVFHGVVLTNVNGTVDAVKDAPYGALLNKGDFCKIEFCSAEGEFRIQGTSGINAVGGLAGVLNGSLRKANDDINMDYVNACSTQLNIEVSGEGSPKIGGAVGESVNTAICNSTVRGSITVTVPDATKISKLQVGGFAGSLHKEYQTAAYNITYLDSSYNLVSEVDITINLTGGGQSFNSVYAGGVFGSVINQSVNNVKCTGDVTINGGGTDLFIGGVVGHAQNMMSIIMTAGSIRLYIEQCEVASAITIASQGKLYSGGLVGYGVKIDIKDTISTVTPQTTGDRGSIVTMVSDTVGYVQNDN